MKRFPHLAALVVLLLTVGSLFAQTAPAAGRSAKPTAATAAPAGDLLDINSVSADQLKTLPGIGDAYAKRIIAGRPYTAKNQLVVRGVVPQATYDKVQTLIIAKRPTK